MVLGPSSTSLSTVGGTWSIICSSCFLPGDQTHKQIGTKSRTPLWKRKGHRHWRTQQGGGAGKHGHNEGFQQGSGATPRQCRASTSHADSTGGWGRDSHTSKRPARKQERAR